jgi:hypothetical protein
MPVDLTCSLVGLVVRIRSKLFLLPLPLAGELTVFLSAISLILYTRIRSKQTSAMCAWNHRVHGFLLTEKNHKPIQKKERKSKSGRIKTRGREAKRFCMRKMEEKRAAC